MQLAQVSLDDKYQNLDGTLYLTGTQALVKVAMLQGLRDRAAGLNTACFISGYRGSPMHNLDKELWRAERFLPQNQIHFLPAVNEDIAVTSHWGTQQSSLFSDALYDGVYSLWYGKGPGLDRSVDAMRHANLAGTSRYGGVLAVVGDDHGMTSTDVPAVSEPTFIDLMMPVLYPGNVTELIEFGLYGWALSRFCGAWVGFKATPDTLDTAASILLPTDWPRIVLPDYPFPEGGVSIRTPDPWVNQEARLRDHKMGAAVAFARANDIDKVLIDSPRPRLGIVASGLAAFAVLEALDSLGIDLDLAAELGIRVLKIGMPHPIDELSLRQFCDGLEEVLVVEEKRRIIELAVKDVLYGLPEARRPRVVGRRDEAGKEILSGVGQLGPDAVAIAIAGRIQSFHNSAKMKDRLVFLEGKVSERRARSALNVVRTPFFCSGCPHNTSTRVPDGSRAHGGVGCHFMATNMARDNVTHPQMGGEGATWIGMSSFVATDHVFQNLGDGTYFHSGLLALRACIAAGVNITYKILYNDAVAMTGGQPVDGNIDPAAITRQVHAEGVRRLAVVTDDLEKYKNRVGLAPGTEVHHRRALDSVQKAFRLHPGVSVIVYDQTCAAEKRRRRKRGSFPDPSRRVFINERVCEGCGDCSAKSNCLSVIPVETGFGRKRRIDQSSCNKDYSCRDGFCPSFVSVIGGNVRRVASSQEVPRHLQLLPEPERPHLTAKRSYNILVTGIGGTGVVTISAMITMAAHLEGRACQAIDQFGMAQKGGAVTSHIRLAGETSAIRAVYLDAGSADLVLGCDALVAASDLALQSVSSDRSQLIINTHEAITGHFTRSPDLKYPREDIKQRFLDAVGAGRLTFLDATTIATRLMGDGIATNMFMLGYAYQRGLVPVSSMGIEQAIELNGIAVESNIETFRWGRRAAVDVKTVTAVAHGESSPSARQPETLNELIDTRVRDLTLYQDAGYAARYRRLVERACQAESALAGGFAGFGLAVARYGYKLMAYKDEYEVARLYSDGDFVKSVSQAFEGTFRLEIYLSPPLFARRDPYTGLPGKRAYGSWMLRAMKVLARLRWLRGTAFDPFGYTLERRAERQRIIDYETIVDELSQGLHHDNHALATEIASLPDGIRGYGHIKQEHLDEVDRVRADLLERWHHEEGKALAV
ncbi:MAG: indolepyruvate ferredoxin oxidoreductase family protein [Arenicellales bacterium]|nr:indolepyruvate ferredoxin oxidoreductase family protein [Arenicellales bacterium]